MKMKNMKPASFYLDVNIAQDNKRRLLIDFDGPIHLYKDFNEELGMLVDGTIEAFRLLSKEYDLFIFTSRIEPEKILEYLKKNNLDKYIIAITNIKLPSEKIVDDRAVHFDNWDNVITQIAGKIEKSKNIKNIFAWLFKSRENHNAGQYDLFVNGDKHEGDIKEGKTGTLRLQKNKSGKGASWNLIDKAETTGLKQIKTDKPKKENVIPDGLLDTRKAYGLLKDKLGNSATIDFHDEKTDKSNFLLLNENIDKSLSLFIKNKDESTDIYNIPFNQAILKKGDSIIFKFSDKTISVSLSEKYVDNENIDQEEIYNDIRKNDWVKSADDLIGSAMSQKDLFFSDLDSVARKLDLELPSTKFKTDSILSTDDILSIFRKNELKGNYHDNFNIDGVLHSTIIVKTPSQVQKFLRELKILGYDVVNKKENVFSLNKLNRKLKITKGKRDGLVKEITFMTESSFKKNYNKKMKMKFNLTA